jgi:hypothetical protein
VFEGVGCSGCSLGFSCVCVQFYFLSIGCLSLGFGGF